MRKKLNASVKLGKSTLRAFCELRFGWLDEEAWMDDENNYAVVGGCIPLKWGDGEVFGYVLVSGGPHECDHQIAAEAMGSVLGVDVPVVEPVVEE
jgi:uncharacterized protein (UPF0303 family)